MLLAYGGDGFSSGTGVRCGPFVAWFFLFAGSPQEAF